MPEEKKEETKEAASGPSGPTAQRDKDAEEEKEVPKKFKDIVSAIEEMSVLDLSELVGIFEDKFGVSAAQPMMVAGGAAADGGEAAAEEKSSFDVEVSAVGDQKINVIKAIREVTELSLKDAKDMVDSAPSIIREGVAKEAAEDIKSKLEEVGATITLK